MLLIKSLKKEVVCFIKRCCTIFISTGHEVVRLLVAHCELNPTEMAWSQAKGHVKDRDGTMLLCVDVSQYVMFQYVYRYCKLSIDTLIYQCITVY